MRIFLQFLDLPTLMKENTEFWLFALKHKSDGSRRQMVKMIAVVTFSSLAAIVFRLLHTQAFYGEGPDYFWLKTAISPVSVFLLLFSMKFATELENYQYDSFE